MNPRVLLIGLDSGDADLIERWCGQGLLPTLQALRTQGRWARPRTTAEVMHVSAWPSLYTGAHPGQHGMYHAYQIRAGDQEVHRTAADECGLPPFWKYLDAAGRRCILFDAFMSYPLPEFSGVQILEYGTWTWFGTPAATPAGLWSELVRRCGPYPAPEHTKVHGLPDPVWFRERLLAGVRVKAQAVKWLLGAQPWDFFFVTFGETHPAGHYLWHVQDPQYPTHPAHVPAELRHAVRDVYVAVDRALGEILRDVDEDVNVLIVSGDGMGPNYSGCHLIPGILHRLGLYHASDVGQGDAAAGPRKRRGPAAVVRGLVPLSMRRMVSRCLPARIQHRLSMKWTNASIDFARSAVFCVPNSNEAYLRLNRQGREPLGTVPEAAAQALLERLETEMRGLRSPPRDQAAAERVLRIDDLYPGPRRGDLPDLVVTWNLEARVLSELEGPQAGRVSGRSGHETAPYYTGNHRPAAFVLGRGPALESAATFPARDILELAPAVLTMLGVEVPASMAGAPRGQP